MKKLLVFFLLGASFASCGSNTGANAVTDSTSVTVDSSSNGTIITDTTGLHSMNTDTTGMGQAR